MLADQTAYFRETLELRGVTLQPQIQPQLFLVLLDNVVKYTNENGSVMVSLEENEKRIKLQFQNTCEQLPSVSPDKLSDWFYRADEARTQKMTAMVLICQW